MVVITSVNNEADKEDQANNSKEFKKIDCSGEKQCDCKGDYRCTEPASNNSQHACHPVNRAFSSPCLVGKRRPHGNHEGDIGC